jgi:Phenylpropionate dioxygenase and related ring-hydroxylating dioxygenases, large terminal subunit
MSDIKALCNRMVEVAMKEKQFAITSPAMIYLDDDYNKIEKSAVIDSGWMSIAHLSQLASQGSYLCVDIFDEPIIVIKNDTDEVHAFSRVCPHRSADILYESQTTGTCRRLVCPYHAWTFDLDGKLVYAPQMDKLPEWDGTDINLHEFRTEIWNGFIFINIDGKAQPLKDLYSEFSQTISPWPMNNMQVIFEQSWTGDFNWKIMVENWSEFYHHVGAHSKTLEIDFPSEEVLIDPEHDYYMRTVAPYRNSTREKDSASYSSANASFSFPKFNDLPLGDDRDIWVFVGYPCFLFMTAADSVYWVRVIPKSSTKCEILTTILVDKDNIKLEDFESRKDTLAKFFVDFHIEDMFVNTLVSKGLKSRYVQTSRLADTENQVWMFYRFLARQLIKNNLTDYPESSL